MEQEESAVADHPSHPSWYGALAGAAAAGVALAFGQLVEALSDDIPGLVLGMGEWIVDVTPGFLIEESIEGLGSSGKAWLLPGITITALLLAALLGEAALRLSRWIGIGGFVAFGLLGGFTTARHPQSPAVASWIWSLVAAGLGVATLVFLLDRLHRPTRLATILEDPRDPKATRRAFLAWTGGAGALAVTGFGIIQGTRGRSAAEVARESLDLSGLGSGTTTATAPPTTLPGAASLGTAPIDDVAGLAPWLTPNDRFYRIDTAISAPQVDPRDWSLEIKGMVDNPYTLTFNEVLEMDLEEHVVTLSCVSNEVGGPLVGNAVWLGVPITTLLDRAGVQPEADQFVGKSIDDWTAGFPTDLLYDGRTALLAVGMNGDPLPIDHGFPARLVVAGIYGYVSAVKWVTEIELTRWDDFNGYWITKGWSKEGPMKTMSRIDVPRDRAQVVAGVSPIAGVAWSPPRGIQAVEVSVDDGPWWECDLAVPGTDETWVQWKTTWDPVPGDHMITVRAIDGDGNLQPIGPKAVAPDGAEGWHRVRVEVV